MRVGDNGFGTNCNNGCNCRCCYTIVFYGYSFGGVNMKSYVREEWEIYRDCTSDTADVMWLRLDSELKFLKSILGDKLYINDPTVYYMVKKRIRKLEEK